MATVGWIYLLKEIKPQFAEHYKIGATRTVTDFEVGEPLIQDLEIGNSLTLKVLGRFQVDDIMNLSEAFSNVSKRIQENLLQKIDEQCEWFRKKSENTTDEDIMLAFNEILAQSGGGRGAKHGPGWIYLLKEDEQRNGKVYYKIGAATHVAPRLSDLQIGNPIPLRIVEVFKVEDMNSAENAAHIAARKTMNNVRGEWFVTKEPPEVSIIENIRDSVMGK